MDETQIQTINRPIAQRLGFRRIIKNRRQEKLRSKLLKAASPRKSVLCSGRKYKSPKKENTPPLKGSSGKPSPKKKTLVLNEPKETEQINSKEKIITINESSDFCGKRKRKTEK